MIRMAVKLLVVALALSVSPLHASNALRAAPRYRAATPLYAAAAELPLPETAFFELVNGAGTPGYVIGSAQGGTQVMIITVSVTVPGNGTATQGPPPGAPDTFNVDSFFDVFSDSGLPGGGAGLASGAGATSGAGAATNTTMIEPDTNIVELDDWLADSWIGSFELDATPSSDATAAGTEPTDLGALDAGVTPVEGEIEELGDDTDWFAFELTEDALVTLATAQPGARDDVDTEIWLYDAGDIIECVDDPSLPGCTAAGQVFNGVADLAYDCIADDADDLGACHLLIGPSHLEPGTYYIRVDYTDFFGPDASSGDYTIDIDIEAGLSACIPSPTSPGCSQVFDIVDGIHDYNALCTNDPGAVCDADALGLPDDPELRFYSGLIGTAGTDLAGSNLSPGDWVLVDLDGDPLSRRDQTYTTIAGVIEDSEDPSLTRSDQFAAPYDSLCPVDANDAACGAVGNIARVATRLFADCLREGAGICPQLLGPGNYAISVSLFPELGTERGDYTLRINMDPEVTASCDADPGQAGCTGAALLQDAFQDYLSGCEADLTPGCGGVASTGAGAAAGTGTGADPSTGTGARSITVIPGTDPGHFVLRETGDSTGIFRVTEQLYYSFSATNRDQVRAIFNQLPPRSVLETDRYRIRLAPDGETLLLRDDGGRPFTYPTDPMAPSGALISLQADISNPDFTVLTGGGVRVTIPSPFATHVDIERDPSAIATTAEEIAAADENGGLVGLISSTGGSTGEVFDISFVNFGKPAVIEGDAVFEPLSDEEAAAVRNALADMMESVNSVANVPGTGYCLEQDKAVPTQGDLFRFANAGKSAQFRFAQDILAAARTVEAAGLLTPDSDPQAYAHSIRQWAIWTAEKGYDKAGFTESFLQHTREVLEANGTQWNDQVEEVVRGLIDNRWDNTVLVLEAAGHPPANADAPVADRDRRDAGGVLQHVEGRPRDWHRVAAGARR